VSDGAKLYLEFDMASSTLTMAACELANYAGAVGLPAPSPEPRWYAAYTCANHEKRVAAELGARDVEHFLPLYSSMRRWKDRRVQLQLPLFPGYVSCVSHCATGSALCRFRASFAWSALADCQLRCRIRKWISCGRGFRKVCARAAPFPDCWPTRPDYRGTVRGARGHPETEKK